MADTPEEHLTEELLDRLLHSAKIETYLDEEHITDRALPDYLNELLDRSGIKRNPLAEKTGSERALLQAAARRNHHLVHSERPGPSRYRR